MFILGRPAACYWPRNGFKVNSSVKPKQIGPVTERIEYSRIVIVDMMGSQPVPGGGKGAELRNIEERISTRVKSGSTNQRAHRLSRACGNRQGLRMAIPIGIYGQSQGVVNSGQLCFQDPSA